MKYYFVFIHGQEDPVPIQGNEHSSTNECLSIFDRDGALIAFFPKDKWHGFTIEHVDTSEMPDLPSIHRASNSGH